MNMDFKRIGEAFLNFDYAKYSEQLLESMKAVQTAVKQIAEAFGSDIYDAQYTEKLVDSFKKWGEKGWSLNAETNPTFFIKPPLSSKDADERMQPYCTEENITEMNEELVGCGISAEDINEALSSYTANNYKSCALMLFSILDHELISKGYRYERKKSGQGKLKTGNSAILAYKDDKKDAYSEKFLFERLTFICVTEAILTLFHPYENFNNEPDCVNRHFLIHGMSKRSVTKMDCLKIWSALYSFVVLVPIMEEETDD